MAARKSKRRQSQRVKDESFDHRLEKDPRFLRRIAAARHSLRAGRGIKLENVRARGFLKGIETSGARAGSSMNLRIRCMFNLCIMMHTI